jgi:peptidoglycan/xylan/chitin deacetylase (PgdA/CDA1 family)
MLRRVGARLQQAIAQPKGQALILLYHRVAEGTLDPWRLCVTPEHFAQQIAVLRERCQPIALDELVDGVANGSLPPRSVAVTFDDGYADNVTRAQPLLERNAVPATIFLATGYLGTDRAFWWDELATILLEPGILPAELSLYVRGMYHHWHLGNLATYSMRDFQRYQRWRAWEIPPTTRHALYFALWVLFRSLPATERDDVLNAVRAWATATHPPNPDSLPLSRAAVAERGDSMIRFGGHSVSHPSLATLPIAAQRDEVVASRVQLEHVLGHQVTAFSYPFGKERDYSMDTATIVREAGFTCACTGVEQGVRRSQDRYRLPRVQVPDVDGTVFARWLSRWLT